MQCPRCKSSRIQRDYDDAFLVARLAGLHKLLCNNCGLVFNGFDPLGRLRRAPSKKTKNQPSRRRGPRYQSHLPTAISLIEPTTQPGKASYSQPSRGHCETISRFGMGLSLVGTRFSDTELSGLGGLLFVCVTLPDGPIEAVVKIVNHRRVGKEGKRKWFLGVSIQQISDDDKERLNAFLEKRAEAQPTLISE